MTISSASGTRAEMFPLVHATSPLAGSSACSAQTSRRSAPTSVTRDHLLRPQIAQRMHHVVATAPEVIVEPLVARVQQVVDVGVALVRHVGVTSYLAHR